ncbi:MAG: galactokinase [Candidatus Marinimicrobia bacterium]|nr:galactokinase [Candidatus Neomarinimicrobiota bacterium]MCF7922566.1 galactokinase [Candidatus Neomarinimicrobiota bacterium]
MTTPPTFRVTSPGRICLFGEHQDYLGLPVIATAINRHIKFTGQLNTDQVMTIVMPDINQTRIVDLKDRFEVLKPRDYIASIIRVLRREGVNFHTGCHIKFSGNIPYKAGSSSSSAMIVGLIRLLVKMYDYPKELDPGEIAMLAYQSEVVEHGEPGGMMDHYSVSVGGVIHINTTTYEVKVLRESIDGLILANSMVPKEILEVHGRIRPTIERAISVLTKIDPEFKLKDVRTEDLESYYKLLPESAIPMFYATVTNHEITRQALEHLNQDPLDLNEIGVLMNKHHERLRDYLQITVPKINLMINRALEVGALGAKINGSGGGGTIAILAPDCQQEVCSALEEIGAACYPVQSDPGARDE